MRAFWKKLRTSPVGPLFVALAVLLALLSGGYFLSTWYQANLIQQARAKAAEQISARANGLAAAVDQRVALLQGLYAFTRTEWPDTTFDQPFEVYAAGIYFNTTGVRTLMIAPEGVARYIFPLIDSPALSGYDILNAPDLGTRSDVQRAILSRGITLSQPGELRQGGFGLTAWEAVYRGKDLWGLVSIAIDMNTVLKDAGLAENTGDLKFALRDRLGYTFYGSTEVWQREPVIQVIGLPEGAWELGGAPAAGWTAVVQTQLDVFRLSELVIASLIALLVYLGFSRQGQLERAVALRTRQIAAARQELERRVEARTHQLATLLEVSRRIGSTLALEPLLEQILGEIKPVLDFTSAEILRLDETGNLAQASSAGAVPPAWAIHQPGQAPALSWSDELLQNQVIESLQPVIEWDWSATKAGTPPICWMGVPLVIKDLPIGMLVFIHENPHYYQDEDARLAIAFAQQVAVAIENARLYEQAGQLAVLEERQRLARELHDSVSQVLYSIGLGARAARAALDQDPAQIGEALEYVNRLAEAGQVEMRALIFELRPESLRTDGLVAALEKQAAVLRTRHQLAVETSFCPEPAVPLDLKETLYRVSQEATHNIVKHARATRVRLVLECDLDQVRLEISDNGVGFDPEAAYPGHLGLKSMRERAAQCQGQFRIDSGPGRGTRVQLVISNPHGSSPSVASQM